MIKLSKYLSIFFPLSVLSCASSLIPLGANISGSSTSFAIWSPDTSNVQLYVNGQTYNLTETEQYIPSNSDSAVYYIVFPENLNLAEYHFLINGIPVQDPYARMTDLNWNENNYQNNDIVIDLNQVNSNFKPVPYTASPYQVEKTPYELDIRDYTIDTNSGISPTLRGTYTGLVQSGSVDNGYSTGLDHLVALGISDVQIMPMFQYGSCSISDLQSANNPNSTSNWGYDPVNYNVPEWRYSQYNTDTYSNGAMLPDPNNPQYFSRIQEVQNMVNQLHNKNIGVIMDVVFNHTSSNSVLGNITSQYYLPNGEDYTGCGNTLNVSNPMVNKMVLDSLIYWIKEYNVDGFRFDLMGVFPYSVVQQWANTINQMFPNKHIILYGEPWAAGSDPQSGLISLGTISLTETTPGVAQVGVFNPIFRDALAGEDNGPTGGFIYNMPNSSYWGSMPIWQGELGASRYFGNETTPIPILSNSWDPQFAYEPGECINYVSCHDNLTIWDKIKSWAFSHPNRNSSLGYLQRIDEFSAGILYTSQGVPFIQEGDEFLRTKIATPSTPNVTEGVDDSDNGNTDYYSNNSYNLGDSVNEVNWDLLSKNCDINSYYTLMIQLRKNHPAFRMTSWSAIQSNETISTPSNGVIVATINGSAVGDSWSKIILIYNCNGDYTYQLPSGNWYEAMGNGNPPTSSPTQVSGSVDAAGTAVTILYQN